MAALNLNLQGNYVPSLDSNALLLIKFNQKDQVEELRNLIGDDVVSAEEYSAAPANVYSIFVPCHVLQHPALCRSHLSYMVKCRGLKLPSIAIDRLAVEVVSAAAALAAAAENPHMGFEIEIKLEVIGTTSANINKLEKEKEKKTTRDEELVVDDNAYCSNCLEELSSGWNELTRSVCTQHDHQSYMVQFLDQRNSCCLCRRLLL